MTLRKDSLDISCGVATERAAAARYQRPACEELSPSGPDARFRAEADQGDSDRAGLLLHLRTTSAVRYWMLTRSGALRGRPAGPGAVRGDRCRASEKGGGQAALNHGFASEQPPCQIRCSGSDPANAYPAGGRASFE